MATQTISRGFSHQNAFRTRGANPRPISSNLNSWSYAETGTDVFAQKHVGGKKTDFQNLGGNPERRLTVVTQFANWEQHGLLLNREEKQFTNITQPEYIEVDVPVGGGNVLVPEIVAANAATVTAAYNGGTSGQYGALQKVTVAPTVAGTYQVAAGSLTFSAADAGCTIGLIVDVKYATAKGYGGAGSNKTVGQLEFTGLTCGLDGVLDGMKIYLPMIERLSEATVDLTGEDQAEITQVFNCIIPVALGWGDAYRILDARSVT